MPRIHKSYRLAAARRRGLMWGIFCGMLALVPLVRGGSVQPAPPSGGFTNSVSFNFTTKVFDFTCQDTNGTVTYDYEPGANGTFNPLRCVVNGTNTFLPSNVGGLSLMAGANEIYPWDGSLTFQLLDAHAVSDVLQTTWKAASGSNTLSYVFTFQISGRTLVVTAAVTNGVSGGFYLDRCENATSPRVIHVPYLTTMNLLYANGVFGSIYFDWEHTMASTLYPLDFVYSTSSVYYAQQALYLPRSDGSRVPLNETVYLTVSPSLPDVLPSVPNPVSPYKNLMANKLVFDDWQTPFSTVNTQVQALASAGITNLWVIVHQWQNSGYDAGYPDVLPASPAWGGAAGLDALSLTVRTNGCLFGLHENYVDFYPTAPSWNTNAIALNSDGSLKAAWSNETTQVQSYEMKPTLAANYLTNFSPQIHSDYGTTAAFLDVHSAVNPSDKVDYDASATNSGMFTETLNCYRNLFSLLRQYHQGPVSGEGYCHFMHVGYIDDVEGQINSGGLGPGTQASWLPLLVDFDLLKLHSKTLVHGVGYYERFYADTNNVSQYITAPLGGVLEYMASELAYGHGGFIPDPDRVFDFVAVAKLEQQNVFPAQQLYANAMPVSILYHDSTSNDMVSVSDYIRRYPANFDNPADDHYLSQVQVTYDNGVIVCVNRHPTRQWPVTLGYPDGIFDFNAVMHGTNYQWAGETNQTSYVLPATNGWVVFAPNLTPPVINRVNVTNGVLNLGITNLLPGNTQSVERIFNLTSNNWQVLTSFLASSSQTNFSQAVSGGPAAAFYRVVR